MVQIAEIPDQSGKTKINLNCQPVSTSSGNSALVFFTDGGISLFQLSNGQIDFTREVTLLTLISFATENGQSIAKYTSSGNSLVTFQNLNRENVDITLATFIDNKTGIMKVLADSIVQNIKGASLEKNKNIVFLSTYLGTKNLSNVVFPIFDIITLTLLRNIKLKDIPIELFPFPSTTDENQKIKVRISLPSDTELVDILPPLTTILPEMNFLLFDEIKAQKNFYEMETTDGKTQVPLFLSQLVDNIPVIIKTDMGKTFFGEMQNMTNKILNSENFTEKISEYIFGNRDITSKINFKFPEKYSQDTKVELYLFKGSGYILADLKTISPVSPYFDIAIPEKLLPKSSYVKISSAEEKVVNGMKTSIEYEKYKISDVPEVAYDLNFIPSDLVYFDFQKQEDSTGRYIVLSWRIPEKINIEDVGLDENLFPSECIETDNISTYVNKNCFSHHVAILGEDDAGENMLIWRIFGLYEKNEVKLPDFTSQKLLYEIAGRSPEIKIKKVRLFFSIFSQNTILTIKKTFVLQE